jgi:hypothetical protein
MKIKLQNLKPGRVLNVAGQQVDVALEDNGQAIVTMTLTIGDGTHFHYPSGAGTGTPQSTTLAPGDHDAVIRISALKMERFGRTYDSTVSVGGTVIARAKGALAQDQEEETDFKFFVVRVPASN